MTNKIYNVSESTAIINRLTWFLSTLKITSENYFELERKNRYIARIMSKN